MQNYKDLKIWEKSHRLTLEIYKITKSFPKDEIYSLTSQARRAAYSVPCNIAEGCGRKIKLDFANFLQISLGSLNELDYLMLLSKDIAYVEESKYVRIEKAIIEIRAMLISFINKVRNS